MNIAGMNVKEFAVVLCAVLTCCFGAIRAYELTAHVPIDGTTNQAFTAFLTLTMAALGFYIYGNREGKP